MCIRDRCEIVDSEFPGYVYLLKSYLLTECIDYDKPNRQFRLIFSRAEVALLNSWSPVQQIVYHMLRVFVKLERLTENANNCDAATLSNYHIKTLMLWACELMPRSWWMDDLNLVRLCVELLHTLSDWLTDVHCPHYFIHNCNLLTYPDEAD